MRKSLVVLLAFAMVFTMFNAVVFAAEEPSDIDRLKAAGIIIGTPSGDTMDDQPFKRQDLAIFMARMHGADEEAKNTEKSHDYADVKDSNYDGYLSWAREQGYMQGHSATNFGYNEIATYQQLLTVLLRAIGIDDYDNAVEVALEEGLIGEEVDPLEEVVRGDSYPLIINTLDHVDENGDTLGHKLGLEGWVVEAPEQGVKSAEVTAINEVTVEFYAAVEDTDEIKFALKRGAAVFGTTVEWNDEKTVATLTTVISLPVADYKLEISGLTEEVIVRDLSVTSVQFTAGIEILSSTISLEDGATVVFKVTDQYGKDMKVRGNNPELHKSAWNITQNKEVTLAGDADDSKLSAPDLKTDETKVGDVIRFIVSYKGQSAQELVTVIEPAAGDVIQLGSIILKDDDVRLNVSDGTVRLDYVLLDQYGNKVSLTKDSASAAVINNKDGIQFTSSNTSVINGFSTNGDGHLILDIAGHGTAIILAFINRSGSNSQTTVTVEENEVPSTAVIAQPTTIVAGGDEAFDLSVILSDQYGTEIKSNVGTIATVSHSNDIDPIDPLEDPIKVALKDEGKALEVDLSNADVSEKEEITIEVKQGGKVIGSVKFEVEENAEAHQIKSANFAKIFEQGAFHEIKIGDLTVVDQYGRDFKGNVTVTREDGDSVEVAGTTVTAENNKKGKSKLKIAVGGATLDVEVEVIESGDIKGYTIADLGTIYKSDNAKYEEEVKINGTNSDGKAVILKKNDPDVVTTSNSAIAGVTGTSVKGNGTGTATISAWKGGKVVATAEVTVSDEVPRAETVKWKDGTLNVNDDAHSLVEAKDQYGKSIHETSGLYFSTEDSTIIDTDGKAKASGTVEVTVITPNGKTATKEVTVN